MILKICLVLPYVIRNWWYRIIEIILVHHLRTKFNIKYIYLHGDI